MDKGISKPVVRQNATHDNVLRSLADLTRRQLLQLLLTEELNVSQLVTIVGQPQSTISRHLKVLRECGLVKDRRLGTTVFYRAHAQALDESDLRTVLLAWLQDQPLPRTMRERLARALQQRSDDSVAFFERLGQRWDELRSSAFGEAFGIEALISLLPNEWTVADIGAGTGFLLQILAEHFRRVVAVEPASTMLECARRRIAERGHRNVEFHRGDLNRLPLGDACCDLAIACLVLHHVQDPAAALAEVHRILRPSGSVLIVEQHGHENQQFYDAMQDLWWGFDPEDLTEKVRESGFEIIARRNLMSPSTAPRDMDAPQLFVISARRSATGNVSGGLAG